MISDAVRWLERDLREVVHSYFQPLRLIARDISDALPKHDRTIDASAEVVSYIETLAEDNKPTSPWYMYLFYIMWLLTAAVFIGAALLILVPPLLLGSIYHILNVVAAVIACIGMLLLSLAGLILRKWKNINIAKHRPPNNQQPGRDL
jgi:hypothetical protein